MPEELREEQTEVAQASSQDTSKKLVSDKTNQEEAPGESQDTLEGLCLPDGLGTPWGNPRRASGSDRGEVGLGFPVKDTAPSNQTRISGRRRGINAGIQKLLDF